MARAQAPVLCGTDALVIAPPAEPNRFDLYDQIMRASAAVFSGLLDGPDTRAEGHL